MAFDPTRPFGAWVGPRRPRILIVGESWGPQEEAMQEPFVGSAGQELWRMLGEAFPDVAPEEHARAKDSFKYYNAWIRDRGEWLEAAGIAFTSAFNLRPPDGKFDQWLVKRKELSADYRLPAFSRPNYLPPEHTIYLPRLFEEIAQSSPNVVVAMGNVPSWSLLQATNIGSIRGTTSNAPNSIFGSGGFKVLPTYHPLGVLRQWSWRPIVVADLMKAGREAASPLLIRQARKILVDPTILELEDWCAAQERSPSPLLSIDIETAQKLITCIGFANSRHEAVVIPFHDSRKSDGSYWADHGLECRAWGVVKRLCALPVGKLFQNGMYDLQYINRMGILPVRCTEDTMLLHHSELPEIQKGLGFLGSIYTNEPAWKLMRRRKADTVKKDE